MFDITGWRTGPAVPRVHHHYHHLHHTPRRVVIGRLHQSTRQSQSCSPPRRVRPVASPSLWVALAIAIPATEHMATRDHLN